LGDFPVSEFYLPTFWNTVCSIFTGRVSRKKNQEEIARVFIQAKVWLKNSLSQSEGGGMGRERVQVENRL
jgi:hypothetical protein